MNRTSNLHKTTKAKPTTQIRYEHSSVETITNPSSESQPLKLGNQSIHNVNTPPPPPPNGFKAPHSSGTMSSMTGKEKYSHSSDSFRMKEPDFGHPKDSSSSSNNLGYYDDNTKFKRQASSYTKPYSEDTRGNSYQSPTRSPLQGSQSFSKSHQAKRGDSSSSSAFKSTNENNNHKGKLFTQPYVPRSQFQTGPPHHQHHQQQQYNSPDTNYMPTSPVLTVAHSPGSSIHAQHHHSYGMQYTTQGHNHSPVPPPQTTMTLPASPRSSAHPQQLSPSLPVPTAPIPIPHTWSASAIPTQYYAVSSSLYDPQQLQYHHHYYSPYQHPLQHPHSSVYGYIPSLTPPLQPQQQQHYQASSPVSPLIQHQKSPSQSYTTTTTTTHHVSPSSRSSKAIPIINPNTMTPVQTELHYPSTNTAHASKELRKPVVSATPAQLVDPAIKEQEEREQQERLEEEEQLRWEQQQQQQQEQQQQEQQEELGSPQKADKEAAKIGDECYDTAGTTTTTGFACLPTDDNHVEMTLETSKVTTVGVSKTTTAADQVSTSPTTNDGVIQYDPAFLMQFMPLCLETAEDLSSFQNIADSGLTNDKQRQNSFNKGGSGNTHFEKSTLLRPGSHGNNNNNNNNNNNSNYSRSAPNGAVAMVVPSHNQTGRTEMGKFIGGRTLTGRTLGNTPSHYTSADHKMQREDSSGARTRIHSSSSSNRGGTNYHPINNHTATPTKHRYPSHDHHHHHHQGAPTIPYEQVAPLEKSANRWIPSVLATGAPATATATAATTSDLLPQDEITRKVKALLNKLTLERFDTISDKILSYAEQSIHETDGQSLRTVIQLIFEKACDEAAFASMWAQLCRKLYEWIPATIKDVKTKDKNDEVMCGIPLYCKYLLSRCQYEFEKGWKSIPEVGQDATTMDTTGDVMLTDEYYNAVKIKRQGLGLVQFIGELYLREMLSQRIMYQCLKRLCDSGSDAHEEEVESLCKLLTTVGADIDRNPQTATWIDFFFKRMKNDMYNSAKLSSRVKFMILDVFDLRKNNWVPRNGTQDGPKTIAEIHEEAEKAKSLEKEALAKRTNRGHTSSTHHLYNGSNRQQQQSFRNMGSKTMKRSGSGGLTGTSPPRHEATDYSNFGRTERSRSRTNVLEPSNSPFPSLMNRAASGSSTQSKGGKPPFKESSNGTSFSNMFSALRAHDDDIDPERKKVTLLSRKSATDDPPKMPSHKALDPAQLKRRIKNSLAEYYEMTDIEELFTSINELDQPDTQTILATELIAVIELKEKQVVAVADLIPQLYKAHLLDREIMVKTFQNLMDGYEELTIDVPQAPAYIARLLIQAGIGLSDIAGPTPPSSLQQALSRL